jgi:hypothetical protein
MILHWLFYKLKQPVKTIELPLPFFRNQIDIIHKSIKMERIAVKSDKINHSIKEKGENMKKKLAVFFIASVICIAGFSQPANCSNPTVKTSPFSVDGAGEFCFEVSCIGSNINSWNTDKIEINGTDYSNRYCDGIYNCQPWPAPINGKFYIHYKASAAWSHFEMKGTCAGVTGAPTEPPASTLLSTPLPTAEPTNTLPAPSCDCTYTVRLSPSTYTTSDIVNFPIEIHLLGPSATIGAFGFDISFDPALFDIFTSNGTNGVEEIAAGLNLVANSTNGYMKIAGFNATGIPINGELALLKINFMYKGGGTEGQTSKIDIAVTTLADIQGNSLGYPLTQGTIVTIGPGLPTVPPTIEPTPIVTNVPFNTPVCDCNNEVWLSPSAYTTTDVANFNLEIHLTTITTTTIGAFGFDITYDPVLFDILTSVGTSGVEQIASVSAIVVNPTAGSLKIAGFSTTGIPSTSDLGLLRINFIYKRTGTAGQTSKINISVNDLTDINTQPIGNIITTGTIVTIGPGTPTLPPTAEPTPVITAEPVNTPSCPCGNEVWLSPNSYTTTDIANFKLEIHLTTMMVTTIGAFGFDITYDPALFAIDTSVGMRGVEQIATGSSIAVNQEYGRLRIAGFNTTGIPGSNDLGLLRINFIYNGAGTVGQTSKIDITVVDLADVNAQSLTNIMTTGTIVTIGPGLITPPPTVEPTPEITAVPTEAPVPTSEPTPVMTGTPLNTPVCDCGKIVWLSPSAYTTTDVVNFPIDVHITAANTTIGAIGFDITFDSTLFDIDTSGGTNGVTTLESSLTVVSNKGTGLIRIAGFSVIGFPGNSDVDLMRINFLYKGGGTVGQTSNIGISLLNLADVQANPINSVITQGTTVTIGSGVPSPTAPISTPETVTPVPTIEPIIPTAAPTPSIAGIKVNISPLSQTVALGTTNVKITAHVLGLGTIPLGAYTIVITYDSAIVGSPAVGADFPGFVTAANVNIPGKITVSGFDVNGVAGNSDLALFYVTFTAVGVGMSQIGITVDPLVDSNSNPIVIADVLGATITVVQ